MSDPARRSILGRLLPGRQLVVAAMMIAALAGLLCDEPIWHTVISAGAAEPTGAVGQPGEATAPAANPNRPTERQIKAYSGLAALAGIVITGLSLAAFIILWAGRLRRQIRRPLPDSEAPVRDFWFLKPPKPTVTDSKLPDSHQPPHDNPTSEN